MEDDKLVKEEPIKEEPAATIPAPVKKRPGRPKKIVEEVPVNIVGISDMPSSEDDLVELMCSNPSIFKKILHLFRQFNASEIELYFHSRGLTLITKDHIEKSNIYAIIDGSKMEFYYCKHDICICIRRDDLEKILSIIQKNHSKIMIILRENYRSMMYIILKDKECETEETYDADVVVKNLVSDMSELSMDENYPITFQLTSKHFKTKINNIKKLSNILTIQKVGLQPLQFTFDKTNKVNWVGIYSNSELIKLKSTIAEDDIFSVSVFIDHIHPLSNANISDNILFALDKREKMSFTTYLEKDLCKIKIYTEIKDYYRGRAEGDQ